MMRVSNPVEGITVYDDVFGLEDRTTIYEAMFKINYGIGWKDHFYGAEQFLHSTWRAEAWDDASLGHLDPNHFINLLRFSKPFTEFENRNLIRTIVNLTTPSDSNEKHSHRNQDVLLYYANPEWKKEWQGETFFLDPLGEEVIYTSLYVPNRMIRFDGNIVHRFNTQSRSAPKFRFSISTFFEKKESPEEKPKTSENTPEITFRNIL
jgi:hypothetical protein